MTKTSKITIGIILFIILLVVSFLTFKYEAGEIETETKNEIIIETEIEEESEIENQATKICCNNTCLNIEIADNDESRQLGLMYRESLPDNNGMLFIFNEPGVHSFWMKNTLIPLAGIRLDSDLKIVDIILMDPCKSEECPSYIPKSEAQYVLEINQGLISEKGFLHIGDKCKFVY